jgi:hypothetical protein
MTLAVILPPVSMTQVTDHIFEYLVKNRGGAFENIMDLGENWFVKKTEVENLVTLFL